MLKRGLLVLVVMLTACGSNEAPGTAADDGDHRIDIEVADGEPVGGVRTESVELGDRVTLTVTADTADEIHLHGYDVTLELEPGEPETLTFEADKPGGWEVELHDAGNLLLELQVG